MPGPVEGLRVIDCSSGTAGPRATGLLADYGADVVWVEPPGGDPLRRDAPECASVVNRGKRSIELDLDDPEAREDLLTLVDRAEVFVESWRPGLAERWGLGYDALHARNPALVYVSISGFGEDSDLELPDHEPIVQAVIGSMSEQAAHRDGPVYLGFPFASLGASSLALIGALAALRRARHDGFGRHVRTSLLDGALAYHSMMWGESDAATAAVDAPLPLQQTTTMRLVRGRPRQFSVMWQNRRCSILFHLLVPGGKWRTVKFMFNSVANPSSAIFHKRLRLPLLPPPSAVIIKRVARGKRCRPICCHHKWMLRAANSEVS